MDLGKVYVTNDANFLYIGIEFAKSCYCDMNLGLAIDARTARAAAPRIRSAARSAGRTSLQARLGHLRRHPTNCNTFNYEVLYKDTVGTWATVRRSSIPRGVPAPNGLGIIDSTSFREMKIPLSLLGVPAGTPPHLEFWGHAGRHDEGPARRLLERQRPDVALSTTTYDTAAVVQMTSMVTYTLQNAVDAAPPVVTARRP